MKLTVGGALLGVATVVVIAAIVAGITALGPPSEERARRLDTRRVSDLQRLSSAIEYYQRQKGTLPSSLDELSVLSNVRVDLRDPERGEPYGFRVVDERRYELCAIFDRDAKEEQVSYGGQFWAHRAGSHCFTHKVPDHSQQ